MVKIYPGITTTADDFERLYKKLQPTGEVLQLDISDGVFVPSKLGSISGIADHPETKFQIHLMVQDNNEWVDKLVGLSNVESIVFHIESAGQVAQLIDKIQKAGKLAGVALSPETPITAVEPFASKADFVQFMTVYPGGYGGQFQPQVLDKVAEFHAKYPTMPIEIDGGMNPDTISLAVKSGATMIESGSYITNSEDPIQSLRNLYERI